MQIELEQSRAQAQAQAVAKHQFTKQNASEMGRLSGIARAEQKRELQEAASVLKMLKQEQTRKEPDQSPEHVKLTLNRTRTSIETLFDRLSASLSEEEELDAGKVDKLCAAVARMAELERVLSMRPAPAPLRSKPVKSRSDSAAPLEPIAEPTQ